MVSQNTSRGRSLLPIQPRTATLAPSSHSKTALSPAACKGSSPQPLKSAHPPRWDPTWREHLIWWHQVSTGIAIVSGLAVLSVYSWTVRTQSQWSQHYQVWQRLQRHEQQFLLTQESIINSLREIAERSDMVSLAPERVIEVPIAPTRRDSGQSQNTPQQAKASPFYPVGY
jgi:hypothetical protein